MEQDDQYSILQPFWYTKNGRAVGWDNLAKTQNYLV
jgi:hypothetical protein